jgi:hypothetical protein
LVLVPVKRTPEVDTGLPPRNVRRLTCTTERAPPNVHPFGDFWSTFSFGRALADRRDHRHEARTLCFVLHAVRGGDPARRFLTPHPVKSQDRLASRSCLV